MSEAESGYIAPAVKLTARFPPLRRPRQLTLLLYLSDNFLLVAILVSTWLMLNEI